LKGAAKRQAISRVCSPPTRPQLLDGIGLLEQRYAFGEDTGDLAVGPVDRLLDEADEPGFDLTGSRANSIGKLSAV
jgi:hypothetical protein